jgi:hypothetical protein
LLQSREKQLHLSVKTVFIMEKKVFRSRISVLLTVFILAGVATPVLPRINVPAAVTSFAILLFCMAVLVTIRYEVEGSTLRIKCCGIASAKIDVRSICLLRRSYNPLSSPASSLKRLAVYRAGKLAGYPVLCALVSPVNEREFIETLKSLNPAIQVTVSDKTGWWRFWDWDI